jgi:hypothetical protein
MGSDSAPISPRRRPQVIVGLKYVNGIVVAIRVPLFPDEAIDSIIYDSGKQALSLL